MALLFCNEVGVEVALGLARKALDLGDGCANLGFLVVKTTGVSSCGAFFS